MKILAFGCQVVPSPEQLLKIDKRNRLRIDAMRPARRSKDINAHLEFHRVVTLAFAFRLIIRLALRFAKQLPLWASVREAEDSAIDIVEKASKGRRGGMPAIITKTIELEIKSYRLHCTALRRKLTLLHFKGTAMQWLSDVINYKHVPLLAIIEAQGMPTYIGTQMVLSDTSEVALIADDFGRKWSENILRTHGMRTGDIDRSLRHQVDDHKVYSTVADAGEPEWYSRCFSALDLANAVIFEGVIQGLRSS